MGTQVRVENLHSITIVSKKTTRIHRMMIGRQEIQMKNTTVNLLQKPITKVTRVNKIWHLPYKKTLMTMTHMEMKMKKLSQLRLLKDFCLEIKTFEFQLRIYTL